MAREFEITALGNEEMQDLENSFLSSIRKNINNFSYWFPKIKDCGIPVPESIIIQLPDEIIKSLFMEEPGDDERIVTFVKESVLPAIPSEWGIFFLKNGCFSNKFDFKDCCCTRNLHHIVQAIESINYDALCYETDGESELVIRKFLFPKPIEEQPIYKIYNGMPLRPEIRVFYDFDKKKALYSANYWDWSYCHDEISERDDTDKLAYETAYPFIQDFYEKHKIEAEILVNKSLKDCDLRGIWSVDLMWHDGQFWLIDMAVGYRSAYWNPELAR